MIPLKRSAALILAAALIFSVVCVFISGVWPISVAQSVFFLLAIGFLLSLIVAPLETHWMLIPLVGVVLWGFLQLFLARSVNRFETWSAILRFSSYLAVFFVGLQVFERPEIRRSFRVGAIYFGCLLSAEAIIQRFTSEGKIFWIIGSENTLRAMGPFTNPDHYCAFMELLFPLALWQALTDLRRRFQFTVISAVIFTSVVTGASRAGFVLIVAELVFVLLFTRRAAAEVRRKVSLQVVAATVSLIVIFGFVVGWDVLLDRFKEPGQFEIRWQLWLSSWRMLKDRPAMGFGLGSWETVYPAYSIFDPKRRADHAHSDWAEWADEGGLPVPGLLLAMLVASWRMAMRHPWGFGVTAVFLHSFVDFPLQEPAIVFSLLTLLAALAQEDQK